MDGAAEVALVDAAADAGLSVSFDARAGGHRDAARRRS